MANDKEKHPYRAPETHRNNEVYGVGDAFKGGGMVPKKHRGHRLTHHSGHSYDTGVPGHKDGHPGNKDHTVNHSHKGKNHSSHHHGAFKYHEGEGH